MLRTVKGYAKISLCYLMSFALIAALVLTPIQTAFAAENTSLENVKAVSLSYTSVEISWNAVSRAVGYEIQFSSDKSKYTTLAVLENAADTSYVHKGLSTGLAGYYRVRPVIAGGYGDFSKVVMGKAVPATPIVTARQANNTVIVTWNEVEGAGAYVLTRQIAGKSAENLTIKAATEYTHYNRPVGETISYSVKAIHTSDTGNVSGLASKPVSVEIAPFVKPVIATNPVNAKLDEGDKSTFTIVAESPNASKLTYQWQRYKVGETTGYIDIPGAVKNSYTTPATSLTDSHTRFRCVVTNNGNAFAISKSVNMLVKETPATVISESVSNKVYDTNVVIRVGTEDIDLVNVTFNKNVAIEDESLTAKAPKKGQVNFKGNTKAQRNVTVKSMNTVVTSDTGTTIATVNVQGTGSIFKLLGKVMNFVAENGSKVVELTLGGANSSVKITVAKQSTINELNIQGETVGIIEVAGVIAVISVTSTASGTTIEGEGDIEELNVVEGMEVATEGLEKQPEKTSEATPPPPATPTPETTTVPTATSSATATATVAATTAATTAPAATSTPPVVIIPPSGDSGSSSETNPPQTTAPSIEPSFSPTPTQTVAPGNITASASVTNATTIVVTMQSLSGVGFSIQGQTITAGAYGTPAGAYTLTLSPGLAKNTDYNLVISAPNYINKTQTVRWIQYSVAYDLNGGSGTAPVDSSNYSSGADVTVLSSGSMVAPSGKAFVGWNTDKSAADAGKVQYTASQTFIITGNITLYAVWLDNTSNILEWHASTPVKQVSKGDTSKPIYGNPPYALLEIMYSRKVTVDSSQLVITMKTPSNASEVTAKEGKNPPTGTVLWKLDGGTNANSEASFMWGFRNLNILNNGYMNMGDGNDGNTVKQNDRDTMERSNDYQLLAGTVVTMTITVLDSATKNAYSISRDYTVTPEDISVSTWVPESVAVTETVEVTATYDSVLNGGFVKFTASISENNKLYISEAISVAPNLNNTTVFDTTGYTVFTGTTSVTARVKRGIGTYAVVEVDSTNKPVKVGTVTVQAEHITSAISVNNPAGSTAITGYSLTGTAGSFVARTIAVGATETIKVSASTTGSIYFYTGTATTAALPTSGKKQSIAISLTLDYTQTMTINNANWAPMSLGTLTIDLTSADVTVTGSQASGTTVKLLLVETNGASLHSNIVAGAKSTDATIAGKAWSDAEWKAISSNGLNVYANNEKQLIAVEVDNTTGFVIAKGISALINTAPSVLGTLTVALSGNDSVVTPAIAEGLTRKAIITDTNDISAITAGKKSSDTLMGTLPTAWAGNLTGANVSTNNNNYVIVVDYDAQGWIVNVGISAKIEVATSFSFTVGTYTIATTVTATNQFEFTDSKIYGWNGTARTLYTITSQTLYSLVSNLKDGDSFTVDASGKLTAIIRAASATATSVELTAADCTSPVSITSGTTKLTITGNMESIDIKVLGGNVDIGGLTNVGTVSLTTAASTIAAGTHPLTIDDAAVVATVTSAGEITLSKGKVINNTDAEKDVYVSHNSSTGNKVSLASSTGSIKLDADSKVVEIADATPKTGGLTFNGASTTVTGTLMLSGINVAITGIKGAANAKIAITAGTITHDNLYYAGGTVKVVDKTGVNLVDTYTWNTDKWVGTNAVTPITNFAAGIPGTTQVGFTWTAATGATSVVLQKKLKSEADAAYVDSRLTLTSSSAAATVTELSVNTEYSFRLVVEGGRFSGNSNVVNIKTGDTIVPKTIDLSIPAENNTIILKAGNGSSFANITEIGSYFTVSTGIETDTNFNDTNYAVQRVSDTEIRIIRKAGIWSNSAVTTGTITVAVSAQLTGGSATTITSSYGKYFSISGTVNKGATGKAASVNNEGLFVNIYESSDASFTTRIAQKQTGVGGTYKFDGFFDGSKSYVIRLDSYTESKTSSFTLTNNKTDANITIKLPELTVPVISEFNTSGIVKWGTVANATSYEVTLSGSSGQQSFTTTNTQYDLLSTMHSKGVGTYQVKVKAIANGYEDKESALFGTSQVIAALTVSSVQYNSSSKTVTWVNANAASTEGYTVRIYRDGSAVGNIVETYKIANGSTLAQDISGYIDTAGAGAYTVTVQPLAKHTSAGTEENIVYTTLFKDGAESTPTVIGTFIGSVTVGDITTSGFTSGMLVDPSISGKPNSINPGQSANITAVSGVSTTNNNNSDPFSNTYAGYMLNKWTIMANTTPASTLLNDSSRTVTLKLPNQVTSTTAITLNAEYETVKAVPFYVAKLEGKYDTGHVVLGDYTASVDIVKDPSFETTGLMYFVTKLNEFTLKDNSRSGGIDYTYSFSSTWTIAATVTTYQKLLVALNGAWDAGTGDPMTPVTTVIKLGSNITTTAGELVLTANNVKATRKLTIQGNDSYTVDFGIRITDAENVTIKDVVFNVADINKATSVTNTQSAVMFEAGKNNILESCIITSANPVRQPVYVGNAITGTTTVKDNTISAQTGGGWCAGIYVANNAYANVSITGNTITAGTPIIIDMAGITTLDGTKVSSNTLNPNGAYTSGVIGHDVYIFNMNNSLWKLATQEFTEAAPSNAIAIGDYFNDNIPAFINALLNGKSGFRAYLSAGVGTSAKLGSIDGTNWKLYEYMTTNLKPAITITGATYYEASGHLVITTSADAPTTNIRLGFGGLIQLNAIVPLGGLSPNEHAGNFYYSTMSNSATDLTLGQWNWSGTTLIINIGKYNEQVSNINGKTGNSDGLVYKSIYNSATSGHIGVHAGWYTADGYQDGAAAGQVSNNLTNATITLIINSGSYPSGNTPQRTVEPIYDNIVLGVEAEESDVEDIEAEESEIIEGEIEESEVENNETEELEVINEEVEELDVEESEIIEVNESEIENVESEESDI